MRGSGRTCRSFAPRPNAMSRCPPLNTRPCGVGLAFLLCPLRRPLLRKGGRGRRGGEGQGRGARRCLIRSLLAVSSDESPVVFLWVMLAFSGEVIIVYGRRGFGESSSVHLLVSAAVVVFMVVCDVLISGWSYLSWLASCCGGSPSVPLS